MLEIELRFGCDEAFLIGAEMELASFRVLVLRRYCRTKASGDMDSMARSMVTIRMPAALANAAK